MEAVNRLDPYFSALVQNLMFVEREPLQRLTTERDTLNVRRAVYSDLSGMLRDFQSSTQTLLSSTTGTALRAGRMATLTGLAANTTVLTASVTASAAAGQYAITNITRAQAQRLHSTFSAASAEGALGRTGDFWLGGTGTAATSGSGNSTVTGAATGSVVAGLRELGTGAYTVETRDDNGTREFRLKDADGRVVAIADKSRTDNALTTGWQTYTAGETLDTKRGVTFTFGAGTDASTSLGYTAAGVKITLTATDSLVTFASKINAASQPEGRDFTAAVVGTQLTLTATRTGAAFTALFSDQTSSGGFGFTQSQAASNAAFSVNGLSFVRAGNTNLSDVIYGATLNLADDAEGKTATLNIGVDMSGTRAAVDAFVSKFNALTNYLAEKTGITSITTGTTPQYRRGALADDSAFEDLRGKLYTTIMSTATNTGLYKSLREVGLTIGDDLKLSVNGSKLDEALKNNLSDVTKLFDAALGQVDTTLSRFTGVTNGYMTGVLKSLDSELTAANGAITDFEKQMDERQDLYVRQFGELQAQLFLLQYQQQQWAGIYNSTTRLA
jgi:flagellar hook-associated protein 2